MNVWRINCKPEAQILKQNNQFEFWIKKGIAGIGWSSAEGFTEEYFDDKNNVLKLQEFIKRKYQVQQLSTKSFSTATNIFVTRMQKGDYIWVRCGNIYKLGKIKSEGLYNFDSEKFEPDRQIGFYREIDYLEKDFVESEVPGKIVASYRSQSTVQGLADEKEMLASYCNGCWTGNIKKIKIEEWTDFFHSSDIEEIVGLYLQIKRKLYIYTSTNKNDTAAIEFEMINNEGKLYGLQVKSGNTPIDISDYEQLSENMSVILFATSENYKNLEKVKNVEIISKEEITNFLIEYKHLLPKRIKLWLE